MKRPFHLDSITRRDFVRKTSALAATALAGSFSHTAKTADAPAPLSTRTTPDNSAPPRPFLTPSDKFRDVSRGNPKPHTLKGDALVQARLTPESWRLEITADQAPHATIKDRAAIGRPLTLADGTALDLPALQELGRKHGVK